METIRIIKHGNNEANRQTITSKNSTAKEASENQFGSLEKIKANESALSGHIENKKKISRGQETLSRRLTEMIENKKESYSKDEYEKMQRMILDSDTHNNIMNEFRIFCKDKLENDDSYKEAMLLTSLFYFFLKKVKKEI